MVYMQGMDNSLYIKFYRKNNDSMRETEDFSMECKSIEKQKQAARNTNELLDHLMKTLNRMTQGSLSNLHQVENTLQWRFSIRKKRLAMLLRLSLLNMVKMEQ